MAREGLNKILLIGNLGMDPELKYTQGGQALLRLRLATTESFMNRSGERQERTEWHTVIVWGKRAEGLHKFLGKGHSLYVEGRIQYRPWEDKDGNKRTSTEITATNIIVLGGGNRQNQNQNQNQDFGGGSNYGNDFANKAAMPSDFPPADDFGDDDIPF